MSERYATPITDANRLQVLKGGAAEPPVVAGRTPPHDLDAEATCLSACIAYKDQLTQVLAILKPEHFYSESNAIIFRACVELVAKGLAVDVKAIGTWLRDREVWQRVGGVQYLALLTDLTPAVYNIVQHAETVLMKWRLRRMIATCQSTAAQGYGDVGDEQAFLEGHARAAAELAREVRIEAVTTASEAMAGAIDDAEAALQRGAAITGIETGIPELDSVTGGWQRKDVHMITGPTGKGKTALAVNCAALHAARLGWGVLVCSMEMPKKRVGSRIACTVGRVDATKLKQPKLLTSDDLALMRAATLTVKSWPGRLVIDARKRLSGHQIRTRTLEVGEQMAKDGITLGLVVIDYAQLANWEAHTTPKGNESQGLSAFGECIVALAEQANVAVLELAQLTDEGRVKSSRNLEIHNHTWINIERKTTAQNENQSDDAQPGTLVLKKQRDGADGAFAKVWWHGRYLLFSGDQWP